jgi:hypothetical protein
MTTPEEELELRALFETLDSLRDENVRLRQWVNDLMTNTWVNCVCTVAIAMAQTTAARLLARPTCSKRTSSSAQIIQ